MGLLDFFGGKKAPRPPKELREIGRWQFDRAKHIGAIGDELQEGARAYAPRLRQLYESAASDIGSALETFKAQGNRALRDLEEIYGPLERKSLREVLNAGGPERQAFEAARARDAVLAQASSALEQQQNSAYARGVNPTMTPQISAQMMAQAYSAGNQARYQESVRGEMARRQMLPHIQGLYNQTLDRAVGVPTRLAEAQGRALSGASNALYNLVRPALGLYNTSSSMGVNAGNMFNADYANQMQAHQADAARSARIFSGITQLGGAMISGGMSGGLSGMAGGFASGMTGGALNAGAVSGWLNNAFRDKSWDLGT